MDGMLLLRASVVWAVTLVVARLLARGPATFRHRLWTLAFVAVLVLPLLTRLLPAVTFPLPGTIGSSLTEATATPAAISPAAATTSAAQVEPIAGQPPDGETRVEPSRPRENADRGVNLLLAFWACGAGLAAMRLLTSLLRVWRVRAQADELTDAEWLATAARLSGRLGMRRRIRLLIGDAIATPMAGGVWRPIVFLPSDARRWSQQQRDLVLAHEIAHHAAHDPIRHVLVRLVLACYWCHPLAWIAAREATRAREEACDEAVLALGARPSVYARVLVDLADVLPARRAAGALAIVERSSLEARIRAILDERIRPARAKHWVLSALSVALLTLVAAAARPVGAATPLAEESEVPMESVVQAAADAPSACYWDGRGSFSGTVSTSDAGGRLIVDEQIGVRGTHRVIEKGFDGLRLCLIAENLGEAGVDVGAPSQWLGRSTRVVLESSRGGVTQRLEVLPPRETPRLTWQVGRQTRAFDAAAASWRERVLAVLDTTWELSAMRTAAGARDAQAVARGREYVQQAEALERQEAKAVELRAEIEALRRREISVRTEMAALVRQTQTLRVSVVSAQFAIAKLEEQYRTASDAERPAIATRIEAQRRDLAGLERQIVDSRSDEKTAELQNLTRQFARTIEGYEGAVQNLELQRRMMSVERAVSDAARGTNLEQRRRLLESRREEELKRLEAAITAVR